MRLRMAPSRKSLTWAGDRYREDSWNLHGFRRWPKSRVEYAPFGHGRYVVGVLFNDTLELFGKYGILLQGGGWFVGGEKAKALAVRIQGVGDERVGSDDER